MFNFFRESTDHGHGKRAEERPAAAQGLHSQSTSFPLEKCCFALVNFFFSLVAPFIVALLTWSHISDRDRAAGHLSPRHAVCVQPGRRADLVPRSTFLCVTSCISGRSFCTLLVYGSAIFYDPRQMESWMQHVINLNPIYWYITAGAFLRHVGRGADPQHGADPVPLRRAQPGPGRLRSDEFPASPPSGARRPTTTALSKTNGSRRDTTVFRSSATPARLRRREKTLR